MQRAVVVACVAAVAVLAYLRLFYGVDFTDESFYVAVPYHFLSGARPYVDEISVQQTTAGLLLTPLVWLWKLVAGRTALVLFVRHLHFVLALALGVVLFASLRRRIGEGAAAFVGVVAFVFAPFTIPSVSYDSLAAELFAAGCFLPGLAGGCCLGLAAFVYPPLAIGVAAACVLRRQLRVVVPAVALPAAGFAALAIVAGPGTIVRDYHRSASFLGEAGGVYKLYAIAVHEWHTFRFWWLALAGFVVCALLWRRRPAIVLVALAPLAFLPAYTHAYGASLEYVAHVGLLGLPLAYALRADATSRELFRHAWIPGLVGGIVTAYSSNNGGVNLGVGFFPGALAALALAARAVWLRRSSLAYVPALIAAAAFAYFSLVPVYRDAPLGHLDATVHGGPFAGLVTTRRKRTFLTALDRDLAGVTAHCRIAFFADFPAGYLLTPGRIDTNAVWTAIVEARKTNAYRRLLVDYWRAHGFPDVAVLVHRVPFAPPRSARIEHYAAADPLLAAVRRYRHAQPRRDYTVYGRCP